ncbi:hypothetical protein LTR97_012267 [Elasticomyces elasticus]|uniref:Uncharacterized protein n=1 Tax=Elasticomyces elasticus TaxID=574655 RepID=A0AAN7W0F8_9PEZI|nr:hypothetical protein LTR97_012267 [Elasticomyces elasticus]
MRLPPSSSQTVHWITDDILAEAFHRFARVSHTYNPARHASSTPGPLEARRRHARRRMGLAAAAASNGPPMIDIGAMFGMGAKMPAQPEKSWRWEAPSVLGYGAPPPAMPTLVGRRFARAKRKNVQVEMKEDPKKAIRESERAFKEMLKGCEGGKEADETTTKSMVEFLQSSKDEPKAQNLHTLTKWLRSRIISIGALQTLSQHLLTKARLRTLDSEKLHATLALILTNLPSQDEGIEKSLSEILEALGEEDRHTTLLRLAQLIRTTHSTNKPSITIQSQASATTTIRTLFRVLDSCPSLQHPENRATHPTWSQIYRRLGTLLEPAALASHLCVLPRQDMSEVLLRFWVRKYLVKASLATPSDSPSTIDHGIFKRLDSLPSPSTTFAADPTVTVLENLLSTYSTALQKSVGAAETDPLITLLVVLARGRVKYTHFLSDVLRLLAAGQTRREVWQTFNTLRLNRSFGIPGEVAKELVLYLSASGKRGDVLMAWRVFVTCPSLGVLGVPDLGLLLIEAGVGSPDRIFRLLNRRTSLETPVAAGSDFRHTRTLPLHPAQIDLAHLVAYHWAKHPGSDARVAFRRVWETYRWLRDRGAPLSPLISRALVRAGVLRQMAEGKNVSLSQLKYILAIVARVEGDHVAMDLDSMVWEPNKRLRGPGAVEARLGREVEARLVRGTRWRVKLWVKRRRGWFDSRGRVERRRRGGRGGEGVRRVETPWQDVWREEDGGGVGLREVRGASWFGEGGVGTGAQYASRDTSEVLDGARITAGSSGRVLVDEPMVGYDPAALVGADDIAATSGVAADTAQASSLHSISNERAKGEVVVRYILELPEEDGVWQEEDVGELVEAGMDQTSRGDCITEGIAQDDDLATAMALVSQQTPAATKFSSSVGEAETMHDRVRSVDVLQTTVKNPFTSAATHARPVPTTLLEPRVEDGAVRFVGFGARASSLSEDTLAMELPDLDTEDENSVEMDHDGSYDIYSAFAEPVPTRLTRGEPGVDHEESPTAGEHLPITLTATNTSLHPSDPDSATVHYVSSLRLARDEAQQQHSEAQKLRAHQRQPRDAAQLPLAEAKAAKTIMKKLLAPAEQRTGANSGHHEKKDREVNAAAWRAFGKTMYTKRKKSGYDPHAGK